MKFLLAMILMTSVSANVLAEGKKREVVTRKVQRVDFTGDTVDGAAKTPDGAFVNQRRGVDFVPLYKVREHFDQNIKGSVEYLK